MNIKVDLTEQLNAEPIAERRVRGEGIQTPQPSLPAEDRVELSSQAQKLSAYQEMAENAPEIRADRIDDIMKQIHQGSYNIDSGLIAARMIQDHTVE